MLSFRLPDAELKEAQLLAGALGITVTDLVLGSLRKHMAYLRDDPAVMRLVRRYSAWSFQVDALAARRPKEEE